MSASLGVAWRLIAGSGRGDRARLTLIMAGTALGTGFLLCAAVVVSIRAQSHVDCVPAVINGADGCREVTIGTNPYTSDVLNQPGLRPGLMIACLLLTIPVLVFLGQCSRVGAALRERRLAALRLAGATPRQVHRIAALDTGCASTAGALLGLGLFLVVRLVLEAAGPGRAPRPLPTDVAVPWAIVIGILVAVPLLATAAGALALRRMVADPLASARRSSPPRPSPVPIAMIALGPVVIVGLGLLGDRVPDSVFTTCVLLGTLFTCGGLLAAGGWLAATIGRLVADHTRDAALLIAGRRLQQQPWAEARAMSAVVLCTLLATGAEALRASILAESDPNDPFYAGAFDLVDIAIVIGLIVAVAGLAVAGAEAIAERRRSLAALAAAGVPRPTLRRAVFAQALLPAIPCITLAAICGPVSARAFGGAAGIDYGAASLRLTAILLIAIAGCALAAAATLPLLRTTLAPTELRYE